MKPEANHINDLCRACRQWESPEGTRRVVGMQRGKLEIAVGDKQAGATGNVLLDPQELEREIAFDTKRIESRKSQQETAAQAKLEQAKQDESINGYLATLEPMRAGTVKKALDVSVHNEGRPVTRRQLVEDRVSRGATVQPNKTFGRVLQMPDGSFLTEKQLTKGGIDYAEWLAQQAAVQQRNQ